MWLQKPQVKSSAAGAVAQEPQGAVRVNDICAFQMDFYLENFLPKWPLLISLNAKTGTVLGERSFSPGSLQLRLMRLWVQGDTETKKPQSSCLEKLSFRIW